MDFSSSVALMSSVIAIIAATICPIISVTLTNRGGKQLRKSEAIFQEKILAFSNFLKMSDEFSDLNDLEQVTAFSNAFSMALLFSSKETSLLLEEYKEACVRSLAAKNTNPYSPVFKNASKIKTELIISMRKDLNNW